MKNRTTTEELAGALSACLDQIHQMKGMFNDEDGAIQRAIASGEEVLAKYRTEQAGLRVQQGKTAGMRM